MILVFASLHVGITFGNEEEMLRKNGAQLLSSISTKAPVRDLWVNNDGTLGAVAGKQILTKTDQGWLESLGDLRGSLTAGWGYAWDDAFVVSTLGEIAHYDGKSLQTTHLHTSPLTDIWGLSPSNVFAVGFDGTILHYDGYRWSSMTSATMEHLQAVHGVSEKEVIAAGTNGVVLRYDGLVWSPLENAPMATVETVWLAPTGEIIAAGSRGAIARFRAGLWTTFIVPTKNTFDSVAGISGDFALAVAPAEGAVFVLDDGKVTRFSELPEGVWGTCVAIGRNRTPVIAGALLSPAPPGPKPRMRQANTGIILEFTTEVFQ